MRTAAGHAMGGGGANTLQPRTTCRAVPVPPAALVVWARAEPPAYLVNRSLTECNLSWLGFGLEDVEGEALIRNALQGTAFECAAIRIGSAVYIDKIVPRPLRAVVQTYDAPRGILHVQLGSQWQGHNDFNGEPYEGRSILISEREVCRSCVSSGASFVVFR